MIRVDQLIAEAQSVQMVAAVLKASGRFTNREGSEIEVPDPSRVREEFDQKLARPLDWEKQRAKVLAMVREA